MENSSFGFIDLIARSGLTVKLVLLILASASVVSWAIVLSKYRSIKKAEADNKRFLDFFWSSKSLEDILRKADTYPHSTIATVFQSGFKELQKVTAARTALPLAAATLTEVENIKRALLRSAHQEVSALERNVSFLASTASAGPFIGLFGTVWGIMNSFRQIGMMQNANLAVVAPGISEALIATAVGLAAAIPAAIFYNYFANHIRRMAMDMDNFSQDLLNIVQRGLMAGQKG